ncbi:MAG: 1-acyl-sn-glycerol-3-phosphate acyltransferase [Clostridia bacterium]|nr:1-acyl-sn-glycerol-3-phosphate acyltransferase [Clostridia bacterium]
MKTFLRVIIEFVFKIYYIIVHRMKVEGRENIPMDEPVIFCANHKSFLDPPLIKITAKRNMYFLAKIELAKNPILKFLGWVFEVMYVKNDEKDINAIKGSLKHLKKGDCIALFPEGTRNGLAKGEKVRDGAAFFAIRGGAKVVPIGISGKMKPFTKLTIRYGKPLDYSSYKKAEDDKKALEEVTEDLMKHILELVK